MSRKSTDNLAKFSNESHIYYIKVLGDVRNILAERLELQTKTSSTHAESPSTAESSNTSSPAPVSALGKRKGSLSNFQNPNQSKTVKTASTSPTPQNIAQNNTQHSTTTSKQTNQSHAQHPTMTPQQQQAEWRQLVAANNDKQVDKRCALRAKPMSYAAAARVAIVA